MVNLSLRDDLWARAGENMAGACAGPAGCSDIFS